MAYRRRDNNWKFPDYYSHHQSLSPESNNAVEEWLSKLKQIWSLWKKSNGVTKMLHEYFSSSPNPYASALYIMSKCEDFHQAKPNSLAFTVMEEFSHWAADKHTMLKPLLTQNIKCDAFNLALEQRNNTLTKLIFSVYKLSDDRELFIEPIKELASRKQYKEACQCATILELHEHFSSEDFVIPLVFQDKLTVAEEFLMGSPNHQQQLVSFMDNLLGSKNTRVEADGIIQKLDIPEVKKDKLYYKPVSKFVARLTKMYNLPPETCPNLNQKRNEGALQFLVHKRYIENTLGLESWREMVREAVDDNKELQIELVALVNSSGDPHEALYWANFYGIPKNKQPYNVQMLQDLGSLDFGYQQGAAGYVHCSKEDDTESWDKDIPQVQYHVFPLPNSSIMVVDSEKRFEQFLRYIKNVPMVGIDSEWKPRFGTRKNELALLQIAAKDEVYILDVCTLGSQYQKLWHELGVVLFANENIIKLGFGLVTDISMIKMSLPHLSVKSLSGTGYIDICTLWKKLVTQYPFVFPFKDEDDAVGESLSRIVHLCLGQPLDKADQFSNWERRPLRESQLLYAALDAYCLLEVYEVLQQCAHEQNIPFHDICNEIMTNMKSPQKSTKQSKKHIKHEHLPIEVDPSPHIEPITAKNFKVVCDNMIQGLGKLLRKCGVDTVIIENEENHDACVRIGQRDHRMIITRGQIYNRLRQYVPKGHCYPVTSDNLEEQLEEVLKYFNVTVTKNDVFSRCQLCNGGEFVTVTQDIMRRLVKASQHRAHLHELDEESRWDDGGDGFSSESDAYSEEGTAPPIVVQYRDKLESGVLIDFCQTRKGVTILVDAIPLGVLNQTQTFYICENCGKCYWDGSHFERVVGGILQNIVS